MVEKDLLNIKEFAEKAGISIQAVYKQLNTRLKDYVVIVDNKKMLKKSALSEIYGKNQQEEKVETDSTENSTELNQVVQLLKEQLKAKDEQIERLTTLLNQEQQLHLLEKQKLMALEDKQREPEQVSEPEKKSFWKRFFGL